MLVPHMNLAVRIAASVLCVPPESISLCLPMIAPPPISAQQFNHRNEIDSVLQSEWDERDGFDAPLIDQDFVDDKYCSTAGDYSRRPSTYGEITSLGARQLFHHMRMYKPIPIGLGRNRTKARTHSNGDIVFFDLGSGAGRLIAQSYLELPRVRKSVGVELAASRHMAAVRAWRKLIECGDADRIRGMGLVEGRRSEQNAARSVRFCEGDLFALDISEATHVYASSLCFTNVMMSGLAEKLQAEAPNLHCVATLQKFPPGSLFDISYPAMEFVEMSWTKARGEGCPVYFYYNSATNI
mmetsp:Transcript_115/g.223  ORF Transcript_115/g.223 Transcript_115/m.223 type:complete len:297 (-) Transcript_115:1061-1951(-)